MTAHIAPGVHPDEH